MCVSGYQFFPLSISGKLLNRYQLRKTIKTVLDVHLCKLELTSFWGRSYPIVEKNLTKNVEFIES